MISAFSRCNRRSSLCLQRDKICLETPMSVSYNHIAIPHRLRLNPVGVATVPLFTMRGPKFAATTVNFELILRDSIPLERGIRLANRNAFLLQKGAEHNSVVVSLKQSLQGPQEVHLELAMRVLHSGIFSGKAVAHLIVHVAKDEQPATQIFAPPSNLQNL